MFKTSVRVACAVACVAASLRGLWPHRATAGAWPADDPLPVLISALHYFGREGTADEAVRLTNVTSAPVTLDPSWSLIAAFGAGSRTLRLITHTLSAGHSAWIARDAAAFQRQFGISPTLVFTQLTGTSLSFANGGGWVRLMRDSQSDPVDALVYGVGAAQAGWLGAPLQPYTVTHLISAEGQVLERRLQAGATQPAAPIDTDTAADWVNYRGESLTGARPSYPGWKLTEFSAAAHGSGSIALAAAPDASYELVRDAFQRAVRSIDLESFTFDNAALGQLLAERAAAGVRVRLLLDGAPVGGLSDQTRWICAQINAADAKSGCVFMRSRAADKISSRYRFLHAKFALIDEALMVLGSENFGSRGMPADDKSDGTLGHRGVVVTLDAPQLLQRAREIFDADADAQHRDLAPWCMAGCEYGPPPAGYQPITLTGGISYAVRHAPLHLEGTLSMALHTSPENHLGADGVLQLIEQAGPGDEVLVQQLDEPAHWGAAASNPEDNPNPRVQRLIAAAQRGAAVRVLLDEAYDSAEDPRSNAATVGLLNGLRLPNLRAALGNPSGLGIHNKMMLVRVGARHFSHVGSWNGSQISAKLNREMSVLVESEAAHAYLRAMFMSDFQRTQPLMLPLVMNRFEQPNHLLISEVMINPAGSDVQGEWVEIFNPQAWPVALSDYRLGDALTRTNAPGEGMFWFPPGATIAAGGVVVMAMDARSFLSRYGRKPDYEIGGYDAEVPDMLPEVGWGSGISLGNDGDEVALLRSDDTIEEVVTWLKGSAPGAIPFAQVILPDSSLQRWPPSSDTDNCAVDFRVQRVPSVGAIP